MKYCGGNSYSNNVCLVHNISVGVKLKKCADLTSVMSGKTAQQQQQQQRTAYLEVQVNY